MRINEVLFTALTQWIFIDFSASLSALGHFLKQEVVTEWTFWLWMGFTDWPVGRSDEQPCTAASKTRYWLCTRVFKWCISRCWRCGSWPKSTWQVRQLFSHGVLRAHMKLPGEQKCFLKCRPDSLSTRRTDNGLPIGVRWAARHDLLSRSYPLCYIVFNRRLSKASPA